MKKILAVVVLLAVAGAGALYWLGGHTERLFRAQMAAPGASSYPGVGLVVTDYRRGLLGAHTRVCVHLDKKAGDFPPRFTDIMSHLCVIANLRYGPLLFDPDGVRMGWAGWHMVLDVAALPEGGRKIVKSLFGDAPPMVDNGRFAFDGSVYDRMTITPIGREVGPLYVKLGALNVHSVENRAGDVNAGEHAYITLKKLLVDGANGGLTIDGIDGDIDIKGLAMQGLPLMTGTFAVNGMTVSQGGKSVLSANLTLRNGNHVAHGLMDAHYGVWFDGLHGPLLTLPVNNGYLGLEYRGLSVPGLKAISVASRKFNALQQRIIAARGKKDADSVMQVTDAREQLSRQLGRIEQVLLEKVLQPGKTGLSMQLLLNRDDHRQLSLTSRIDYRGLDGKSPAPGKLAALGPPGWLRLVDAGFHLDASPAALPPTLNARLPVLMKAGLVTAGPDGRINSDVALNNGTLTVNGRATSPGQLTQSLSGGATH